jgi:trafficking protein particle complex subunit 10
MIVHVVLPDTPAASQPPTSKHLSLGTTDSTDSVTSKSKWPGKNTSTLYEKLKADFDGSSKLIDRVAQVRIPKNGETVTTPKTTDTEDQWQDLVEKLKVAILASFDLRVSQYEEDIRERDSQRTLPGWNFCTFFILKEGLARGFESVGLLEDALVGYDELAIGLDVVIREQAVTAESEPDGTFLPFSRDLKSKIRIVLEETEADIDDTASNGTTHTKDIPAIEMDKKWWPLDENQKPFRELILSNEVSIFDFRTYIFIRQRDILLRSGGLVVSSDDTTTGQQTPTQPGAKQTDDLFLLAGVCHRANEFINLGGRSLRQELYTAWGAYNEQDLSNMKFQESVISNIVSSWKYCAALQILDHTKTPALVLPERSLLHVQDSTEGPFPTAQNDTGNSRLPYRSANTVQTNGHHLSQGFSAAHTFVDEISTPPTSRLESTSPSDRVVNREIGVEELASGRMELYLTARDAVQLIGMSRNWIPDLYFLSLQSRAFITTETALAEVSLGDKEDNAGGYADGPQSFCTSKGIQPPQLARSSRSRDAFEALYHALTQQAYLVALVAKKPRLAEHMILDMAILAYHFGRYESVAGALLPLIGQFGEAHWNDLRWLFLEMLAVSLGQLGRRSEYIDIVLEALAARASEPQQTLLSGSPRRIIDRLIQRLPSLSWETDHEITLPVQGYFRIGTERVFVHHFRNRDGFYIPIHLTSRFGSFFSTSCLVTMVLRPCDDSPLPRLELRTAQPATLGAATEVAILECRTTLFGWYEVQQLEILVGKVTFRHDCQVSKTEVGSSMSSACLMDPVLVYPASSALDIKAKPERHINLFSARSLLIEVQSGSNDISDCSIRLKSMTAGLRLRLHEAVLTEKKERKSMAHHTGNADQYISFSAIAPGSRHEILIPYTLESLGTASLTVRTEVSYKTKDGTFTYLDSLKVSSILPISVSVQDIFQQQHLFSRFSISPATAVPIYLESCHINSSEFYRANPGHENPISQEVFPGQSLDMLYKFVKRGATSTTKRGKSLVLEIELNCIDEAVMSMIEESVADFVTSPLAAVSRLLAGHVMNKSRAFLSEQELERVCMVQEFELWPYESIGWETMLSALRSETCAEARKWLKEWHQRHRILPLAYTDSSQQRVSIPVEIPGPKHVFSASLDIDHRSDSYKTLAVGEPLAATLTIQYSDVWQEEVQADATSSVEACYEVIAPMEMWLVGGRRKGNFTPSSSHAQAFPIMLVPQRPGQLLLPSVDIKCFTSERQSGEMARVKGEEVCEVDYRSQATCVVVLADLAGTTVTLDSELSRKTVQLTDMRRRIGDG